MVNIILISINVIYKEVRVSTNIDLNRLGEEDGD